MSFPILWVIHFLQSQKAFHHECVDALHIESFPKISIAIFKPKPFEEIAINNHGFRYLKEFMVLFDIFAKGFPEKRCSLAYFTFCTIKNSLNSPNILAIPIFANIVPIVRTIFTHIRSATDWVAFHRERVYAHI